jgi:hypothetical protein
MIQAVLGVLLASGIAYLSFFIAYRLYPHDTPTVRWSAFCLVGYGLLLFGFLGAASTSAFRTGLMLPIVIAGCAVAGRRQASHVLERLAADLRSTRQIWNEQPALLRAVLIAGAAFMALRVARGTLAPPLAWDSLTYHLFRAGRWAQTGAWVDTSGPDAAAYYEHFSPYGDALWAWTFLVSPDGCMLAVAGLMVWASIIVGFFDASVTLGASRERALQGAAIVCFMPAIANYVATAYVDNVVLALFLLSIGPIVRSSDAHDKASGALAGAALGSLAGTKSAALPLACCGLVFCFLGVFRSRRHFGRVSVTCLIFTLLAGAPLVRAWVRTGSPTYPFPVTVKGRELLAGNAELKAVLRGDWASLPPANVLVRLFVPIGSAANEGQFLNIGLGPLFVVAPAFAGAVLLLRRREARAPALYLLVAGAVTCAAVASPDVRALRSFWVDVLGRLIAIAPAALVLFATVSRSSPAPFVAALVASVPFVFPKGLSGPDASAALDAARFIAPVALVSVIGLLWMRRGSFGMTARHFVAAGGALVCGALLLASLTIVRTRHRYEYYQAAANRALFEMHPLHPVWAGAWPHWQALDTARPLRIAISAGWSSPGHNWYRYPLLGSRLQNTVTYLPVTSSGVVRDYIDGVPSDADCEAWVERLDRQGIDYLVLLPPLPLEERWAAAIPRRFSISTTADRSGGRVYHVNRTVPAGSPACR